LNPDLTLTDDLLLLKTVVEESPVATALYSGAEMTIRLVNKAMLRLWKKEKDVIGQPFDKAVESLFSPQISSRLNEVYRTGITYQLTELRLDLVFNNQLQACYYNIIFTPLKNVQGSVWAILVTAVDVTDQVKAKREARRNDELHLIDKKFKNLINQAPVAIGVFSGWNMIIESVNDSLLELWGKDETVVGLPLLEALPEIQDTDFMQLLQEVYLTGNPYYGYEVLSKLSRKKHFKDTYFNFVYKPVIEKDGKINKILVVANDVTAQVQAKKQLEESERRFKNLILEAPMATALFTGENLLIEVANETMLSLWGKKASVIGKPLAEALPELEGQPFLPILHEIFTTGETYHSNESKGDLVVDGKLQSFYFNFTYKPLFDIEGKVYGIINTALDVTSEVHARIELEESGRKKDEFLSVASHELKTPLTSLKASMQIIGKLFNTDPTSNVIPVFVHKANSSLVKILHLIDDLMHVSKIEQGQLPLNKTYFKLAELVNDCCDHVRADSKYELVLEGERELEVFADHARVDQVVTNLVNNAVKYAPGSNKIILLIEKTADGAKVSVRDFGIGIPLDKQQHLFDRYYRVDASGIKFSGLGLGLYISAEIIERHGGQIGVNSEPGIGSTFWFTLPL
jgi:signal transduction histidine kinase